jgi:hypothetical protein
LVGLGAWLVGSVLFAAGWSFLMRQRPPLPREYDEYPEWITDARRRGEL